VALNKDPARPSAYKADSIIPDVAVTLDCLLDTNPLDIQIDSNAKSFLFDVSFKHCVSRGNYEHLIDNIQSFSSTFDKVLSRRDNAKFAKYESALGASAMERFSSLVFDSDGCVSTVTRQLLDSKFQKFRDMSNILKDNYDKSLKWFFRKLSMNVARSNYAIFREYVSQNGGKY
jgi:hypothetical protein